MIRTRVGYAGGTTPDPTYEEIGDHSETIQIDYDPEVLSYEELLSVFWSSHNPSAPSWSTQYRSAIFVANEEQRRAAEESREKVKTSRGSGVQTSIEPLKRFYPAEDYHQKYYLRQEHVLMTDFMKSYPVAKDFMNSPAAAKVNGFLSGTGSEEYLRKILPGLGLSEEGEKRLRLRVR